MIQKKQKEKKKKLEKKMNEWIHQQEEKLENKIYNDIISEEIGLKDDYSIGEESFHEEEEYSLPLKKKRKMCELSRLLLNDNVEEFKKTFKTSKKCVKTLDNASEIVYNI